MLRIKNIKLSICYSENEIKKKIYKILKIEESELKSLKINKRSLDCRNKNNINYVCSVDVELVNKNENAVLNKLRNNNVSKVIENKFNFYCNKKPKTKPVIVGFGPGGVFAALTLCKAGIEPVIIERGKKIEERQKDIENFWNSKIFLENSNVQFGEGGAGTFSDGKLNTGVKSKYIPFILETFVKHGADKDILINAKPHIGTDVLRTVIKSIREELIRLGAEIRFESCVDSISFSGNKVKSIRVLHKKEFYEESADNLILSIGHSARDTFEMLYANGVAMQAKAFSLGVRIEHIQEKINKAMYGKEYRNLPAAEYKLSTHLPNGRGVYTFCMCPGGFVVASSSEKNHLVINGMSNFKRDNVNSNSALLVNITPDDYLRDCVLDGVKYQREWENKAFQLGGRSYFAPVQKVSDFLRNKISTFFGEVLPSYKPGVEISNINECLPSFVAESIKEALPIFERKIRGFSNGDALITAIESRSSSPVRILRKENGMSENIYGLYPCAEGAGYAGGIMSSAVDGINTAKKLIKNLEL